MFLVTTHNIIPPPPNKTGLQSEDVAGMKEDMYSYGQLLSEMLNPQHQGI